MKIKRVYTIAIVIAGLAMLWAIASEAAGASLPGLLSFAQPTVAPSATPGKPLPGNTSVPLGEPLVTEDQALEAALQIDAGMSIWDSPWSKDTLRIEPGRIAIKLFQSRTEESKDRGSNEVFAPQVDAAAGPVWRISIAGTVYTTVLSPRLGVSFTQYDGITYVISQQTGELLEVITGRPLSSSAPAEPRATPLSLSSPYPAPGAEVVPMPTSPPYP